MWHDLDRFERSPVQTAPRNSFTSFWKISVPTIGCWTADNCLQINSGVASYPVSTRSRLTWHFHFRFSCKHTHYKRCPTISGTKIPLSQSFSRRPTADKELEKLWARDWASTIHADVPPRSNVSGSFLFYFARFHSPWSGSMSKDIYNSCW